MKFHRKKWQSGLMVLAVMAILVIIDLAAGSSTSVDDRFEVAERNATIGGLTGRTKYKIRVFRPSVYTSMTGWWSWTFHRYYNLDVPRKSWDVMQVGETYTWEELNKAKGRSLVGSAWDFIKKPR